MAITKLFSLYKDSYARQLPETEDGFVGYKSMSEQHLSQTAQNEFLLKNDDGRSVRIKKHGTNFYHRCVSWVEARVFSRAGRIRDTRQQASTDFAQAVSHALFEMGIDGHDEHPTVQMIREHASKSLPLRSSVVRDVLEEVAELGYRQSPEIWAHDAPSYTKETFDPDCEPDVVDLPDYGQLDGIPPLDEPPAYEDEVPPAYDEAVADQGNVRDPDNQV